MSERGKHIDIEGGDGTGKSTQVERIQRRLANRGIRSILIHEPDGFEGSVELGLPPVTGATELRKIIKNGNIQRDPWSDVLLFTAARRLNWLQAMKPALEKGVWVLKARSHISTVAYQGYGDGIDPAAILRRTRDDVGEEYMNPDLEIILALNDEIARFERIGKRGELENPDTFESKPEDFQRAMQQGYLKYASEYGTTVIDASDSLESVEDAIWLHVEKLLTKKDDHETIS